MYFRKNELDTPIGRLVILSDSDGALRLVDWAANWEDRDSRLWSLLNRWYSEGTEVEVVPGSAAVDALAAYMRGDLLAIDELPVAAVGTEFQLRVWRALRTIPAGTTLSYGELAKRLGQPGASRAVGLANGANPIAVVVPCHRVIGASGKLTGYGGGLPVKEWLLRHEAAFAGGQRSLDSL